MNELMSLFDHSSLLISIASLMIAVTTARRGGRTTQLQNCLELVRIFDDAFEAVKLADDTTQQYKLIKVANMLENLALFVNRGIVKGPTKETAENMLLDTIAAHVFQETLDTDTNMIKLPIDGPSFKEIARFRKRNAAVIAARAKRLSASPPLPIRPKTTAPG